jgi:UDP-N-acetylmuramyl-tripeptide synthetase
MSALDSFNQVFTGITADSRLVKPGSLFLAYPGTHSDGRQYIPQAIAAGAAGVIWDMQDFAWHADWQVKNTTVAQLKQHVGELAAEYFDHPSKKVSMIGVTGTNGKTSVSQWIAQCLTILGQKTAVLGTIGNGFVDMESTALTEAANTTPDAILLQSMLADYVAQQAKAVVMEVSSHGLEQGRVNGVAFDIAILTNLSRDHLDYHLTMEAYAAAKQKLFDWDGLTMSILNADDAFGQSLIGKLQQDGKPFMSYGLQHGDVAGSDLRLHQRGLTMQVTTPQGQTVLNAPVLGRFNAYNLLAVLATLLALNVRLDDAIAAIAKIKPVTGRMQQFGGGALPLVVIDYAHTPDALEKVLTTLKEQNPVRLICVFGCGGDRDEGKRPLMGAIASKLADEVIVTSDNPRSEDPLKIIGQIKAGLSEPFAIAEQRDTAINMAINSAHAGDIVLIAGKGHEDYQEIAGVRHSFSDALVAQAALAQYQTSGLGASL